MARAWRWAALALLLLVLILGPFAIWGAQIDAWVEAGAWRRADPTTPALILATLLVADGLLPVPSSLVSMLLGMLLGSLGGAVVGTAAMTMGVALSHALGLWGGRPVARRLVGEAGLARAGVWLNRRGPLALALCRPVPLLAEASVIAAGAAGMRLGPVLLVTGLSNLGISAIYAGAGALATGPWGFLLAFLAAMALPGALMCAARWLGSAPRAGSGP